MLELGKVAINLETKFFKVRRNVCLYPYVDYHMRAMRFNIFNKIFMNRRDEVSIHFVFLGGIQLFSLCRNYQTERLNRRGG